MAGALAMSIGRIGAAGDTDSSAASGILIATLRICPSLEEDFVNALGALGARASAVGPTLLLIAKDESRPLDRRALASRWLWELGTAVEPRDQTLLLALEKKRSLLASGWRWDVSQVQEPKFEKGSSLERKNERWIAAKRAAHQIDICREEIGLSPLDGESVQEWSQSDSEVSTIQRIAACLEKRLCGPNHESYLTSMSRCCRGAFAKKRPSWCPAD